ncbi:MAG: hypothetical protein M5R41_07005 [Bacteroidia bacterium]|nr:hypothetical protein [Bacteroidia bacterium]
MAKPKENKSAAASEKRRMEPENLTLSRTDHILLATVAVFVLLRGLATLIGGGSMRLWGLDYAAYLPLSWDVVAVLSLPLVLLVPPVRMALMRLISGGTAWGAAWPRLVTGLLLLAGLLALAWYQQVAWAFLGDGAYYATEIFRITADAGYQTALIKPTSWLTGQLIHWLSVSYQPENVRWPFLVLGLGGLVIVLVGAFLFSMHERRSVAVLLVSTALLSAASLMFFGYIELYALSYSFTVLFFLASIRALRKRSSVIMPGLFLLAAILFGASAAVFIPAWLLLLHWRYRGEGGALPLTRAALILSLLAPAAVIVLYVAGGIAGYNPYLLSLLPSELVERGMVQGTQSYTVFSFAHILDIVNLLLLNGGVLVVLLPVMGIVFRRSQRWKSPALLFGATAAAAALTLLLFGNTTFGLLRDWDLMTIPLLGLLFFTILLLLDAHALKSISLPVLLAALLLTSFGSVYTWFRVNLDEEASAARLEDALQRDRDMLLPLNTYTGLENLRKFYHSVRDRDRQRDILKEMAATGVQKITTYTKYSTLAVENTDAELRRKDFHWLFGQYLREYTAPAPANSVAALDAQILRENASKALLYGFQSGEAELAAEYLEKYRPHIPQWKEEALLLTFSTPGLPPHEVAAAARQSIDEQTQDAALLLAAARLHNQAREFEYAAKFYRLSMQRDDRTFPILYIELAQILFEELNRKDEAVLMLAECRRVAPNSREAQKATDILTQLGLFP